MPKLLSILSFYIKKSPLLQKKIAVLFLDSNDYVYFRKWWWKTSGPMRWWMNKLITCLNCFSLMRNLVCLSGHDEIKSTLQSCRPNQKWTKCSLRFTPHTKRFLFIFSDFFLSFISHIYIKTMFFFPVWITGPALSKLYFYPYKQSF